ncbi:hypothetical protein BRD56_05770 [Thermoplasmatales archaeon SW_10_69_26]|nr:MAG: hypothetical protein BRD56_05770 [Thermoplasmatales archaeon SW_10_69_26]
MSDDHHNIFRDCVRAFVDADYGTCRDESRELWDEHPSFHVGALVVLSLQRLERFDEAERFAGRFAKAAGDSEWDQNLVGLMIGKYPAPRVLSEADSVARRAAALYYEGARRIGEGDTGQAAAWLQGAIEAGTQSLEDHLAKSDFQRYVADPDPDEDVSRLLARCEHLLDQEKAKQALQQARRAAEVAKDVLGERHVAYADALETLASVHDALNNRDEAVNKLTDRRAILHEVFGDEDPLAAQASEDLAKQLYRWGRWEQAHPYFEEVLGYYEQTRGEDHPDTIDLLKRFAGVTQRAGHPQEAIPMYERVLDHAREEDWEDPRRRQLLIGLGHAYTHLDELDQAEQLFEQATDLEWFSRWTPAQRTAYGRYPLARVALERGNEERARHLIDEAVDGLISDHPDDPKKVAMTIANVAGNLHSVGFPAFALPYKERAVEILEDAGGPTYKLIDLLMTHGSCLRDVGEAEQAAQVFKRAYHLSKEDNGPGHRRTVQARNAWEQARQDAKGDGDD